MFVGGTGAQLFRMDVESASMQPNPPVAVANRNRLLRSQLSGSSVVKPYRDPSSCVGGEGRFQIRRYISSGLIRFLRWPRNSRPDDQADGTEGELEPWVRLTPRRKMCRASLGPLAVVEMNETIPIVDYEMKIAKYLKTKIPGDLCFRIIA